MERTADTITPRSSGFNIPLTGIIVLTTVFIRVAPGQEKAAMLLAEEPDSLSLFNQYEQRLSQEERDQLEPFEPMRILRESGLLSDGFTRCMSLEVGGVRFYLELDEKKRPLTTHPASFLKIYRDVTVLHDTVRILSDNVLTLRVPAGKQVRLGADATLMRLFSSGPETFVLHIGKERIRGWVRLDPAKEKSAWALLRSVSVREVPSSVADRIASRLNGVNRRLQDLYLLFGKETGTSHVAPQWQLRMNGKGLLCVLSGDSAAHVQSTRLLARELGGFLIGTTLDITVRPGRIEIGQRR